MLEITALTEMEEMDQRIREVLGPSSLPEYTVEPVPSGVPIALLYEKGALAGVLTTGEPARQDVTRNVKTILSVPLSIHSILAGREAPARLVVWGIVYAEKAVAESDPPYRSVREMVSESLIGADVRDAARRSLDMFCYGAEREFELSKYLCAESHFQVMQSLQDWGFRVNKPHIRLSSGIAEAIREIRLIEEQRESYAYELSGALVQLNLMAQRSSIEKALKDIGVIEIRYKPQG